MKTLKIIRQEMYDTLRDGVIPFWLNRSVDTVYGGFQTSFDRDGCGYGEQVKNIVTQSRMVWGFSNLIPFANNDDISEMKEAAKQGAQFLRDKFWDDEYGGFYWMLNQNGTVLEPSKLSYGQSFGIYALSEYYLMSGEQWALEYAIKAFDCLQKYSVDSLNGGYFENVERDWTISPAGSFAGDRKSLDIHMHLIEAFTTLYVASGEEIHGRKLQEVYDLVIRHMVNHEHGYGYNQFDLEFNRLPAINIARTWNAERQANEAIVKPLDTTSYGHNAELSWLGDLALSVLKSRKKDDNTLLTRLIDHTVKNGFDREFSGIFRDGVGNEKAVVTDKEWWQNFETMVGLINGYAHFEKEDCIEPFKRTWDFVRNNFLDRELGESYQLLNRRGDVLVGELGNPWKGIYHTGRALSECIKRLDECQCKEISIK